VSGEAVEIRTERLVLRPIAIGRFAPEA